MPNVNAKPALGRQTHLPFKRAFLISMNSLKIRFWRSVITAGGIFLGIAFLAVVLTQSLMQWPVPEKVDAGFVRVGGQITRPYDYEVWKPIPVQEGVNAGIPADVVKYIATADGTFSLAKVVQGKLDLKRAERMQKRVNGEWAPLSKIKDKLAFYTDAAGDKDMKVEDAVKYGVPERIAARLAGKGKTFKGSLLADYVREQGDWLPVFYSAALLDQDISIDDAVKAGVPATLAKQLAGDAKTFKAGPLNDAIKAHPTWMAIWSGRLERNKIFEKVDDAAIGKLDGVYAFTLGEVMDKAKSFAKDANKANVMIVNLGGRRLDADFTAKKAGAAEIRLKNGDNVYVPELTAKYRSTWLVVMALLVSTVGITNSMLMAVTERFKEIGTMKCLGALDSFVVTLFMLESGMMGIVASFLGWFVGFVTMIIMAGFTKGWAVVGGIGFLGSLEIFGGCIFSGLLITTIATIAPAKRAANMPAAMALRSEI